GRGGGGGGGGARGRPPVLTEIRHDLVEPDVGGLQGPVENVEAGCAHDVPHDRTAVADEGERRRRVTVPKFHAGVGAALWVGPCAAFRPSSMDLRMRV